MGGDMDLLEGVWRKNTLNPFLYIIGVGLINF